MKKEKGMAVGKATQKLFPIFLFSISPVSLGLTLDNLTKTGDSESFQLALLSFCISAKALEKDYWIQKSFV